MENWSMRYFIRPHTIVLNDTADNFAWMSGAPAGLCRFLR